MAGNQVLRAVAWVVLVLAATISGLAFLLAVILVAYEHSGSSPWSSRWAALGSVLVASVGPAVAGLGIQQLLKRHVAKALVLAGIALAVTVGWYYLWAALWA